MNESQVGMTYCTLKNIYNTGIYLDEKSLFRTFENNTMNNVSEKENCYPIHFKTINTISTLGKNNVYNTSSGIYVETSDIKNNITLIGQNCPFIFAEDITCSGTDIAFFISEGSTIRLQEQKGIYLGMNLLLFKAEGLPNNPVIFEGIEQIPGI